MLAELLKIPHKVCGDNILIKCPFHHDEKPSLSIYIGNTKVPWGTFHCFGCGKSGSWNTLAKILDLPLIKPEEQLFTVNLDDLYPQPVKEEFGIPWDSSKSWRGINGELLAELQCKYTIDTHGNEYIILPVKISGELKGYIKATLIKRSVSYFNSKGNWSSKYGLFPYDRISDRFLLVEGPRDALFLIQNGIPAMATLGANNWSPIKRNLVLHAGIPILCFDGDRAGREGMSRIYKDLRQYLYVKRIWLDEGQDPCTLNPNHLEWLREIVNG